MGKEQGQILFDQLDTQDKGFLTWSEFQNGMKNLSLKTKKNKIKLFMKIADTDGNGLLSFDEIFDLAKNSIKQNFAFLENFQENQFIEDLSKFLSQEIFKICGQKENTEIPLQKIFDLIINQKDQHQDLLLFFCGMTNN